MTAATFASLQRSPGYRRYTVAQVASLTGSWMQVLATSWLVLDLTGSGTRLGLVVALQTLPVLVLGPVAGVAVDRADARRVLLATQVNNGVLAGTLAVLVATDTVRLGLVELVAVATGVLAALEHPARQAFVTELVGPEVLANALTIHSVVVNVGRIAGPALGALVIGAGGLSPCFAVNAVSYLAVAAVLVGLRAGFPRPPAEPAAPLAQLRAGFAHVAAHPELRAVLVMGALVGTLTYEFNVVLPLLASETFGGAESATAALLGAMGVGAVAGGLALAHRARHGLGVTSRQALVLGATVAATAAAPSLPVAVVGIAFVGAASVTFLARSNATVSLLSDPRHRGHVLSLWTMAFVGSTPVGGPVVGWVAEHAGARAALALGAVTCVVAVGAARVVRRTGTPGEPEPPLAVVGVSTATSRRRC